MLILDIARKLRDLLDRRERRNAAVLFMLVLCTGVMEALGVASIMPFLSVLSNPEVIQENYYLSLVYRGLNFASRDSFLLFLGAAVFIVVICSLSFKAVTQYALARFTQMRNFSLSSRLLGGYLARPYSWFLNRHSADLGKAVLSEVQQVVGRVLMPACQFTANCVIASCLIILLLLVNFRVAVAAAVLLGGIYALLYSLLRNYLRHIGEDRARANKERFQVAQEALGGIKEVKAAGLENGYLKSFGRPARRLAKSQAACTVAGQVPNFFMQALAFGGILAVALVLLASGNGELEEVLPVLGVFAFAGQRLLPALQQVYQNIANMSFGKPALDELHADLTETNRLDLEHLTREERVRPTGLKSSLQLVNIEYRYPGAKYPALQNLHLDIAAKSTIGFVGATGAGKTTVVDLILGLLTPQKGEILVDGMCLGTDNLAAWQRSIGYVPQQIFLADDSVAANIAFGVPREDIDHAAVVRAAKIAELHEFVSRELTAAYETEIGERGVRLSGGQRQRIGIARAMYHDPDVLIMDEATSALDNFTEKAVMQAVHNLSRKKTIILVAHRLSTVQDCDRVYMFDRGRLRGQGSYNELLESDSEFRKLANR